MYHLALRGEADRRSGSPLEFFTRHLFKTMHRFDRSNKRQWPDLSSRAQTIVIYEFYGVPLPEEEPKDAK